MMLYVNATLQSLTAKTKRWQRNESFSRSRSVNVEQFTSYTQVLCLSGSTLLDDVKNGMHSVKH